MGNEPAETTALDDTAPTLSSLAPEYKHEHHALYFTLKILASALEDDTED